LKENIEVWEDSQSLHNSRLCTNYHNQDYI